jgi:hypothetical protein
LEDLGYQNIATQSSNKLLDGGETNAIAIDSNVSLGDLKMISLAIIRAGFMIRYLRYSQPPLKTDYNNRGLVRVLRMAPKDGSPVVNPPLTVENIIGAKDIKQLLTH